MAGKRARGTSPQGAWSGPVGDGDSLQKKYHATENPEQSPKIAFLLFYYFTWSPIFFRPKSRGRRRGPFSHIACMPMPDATSAPIQIQIRGRLVLLQSERACPGGKGLLKVKSTNPPILLQLKPTRNKQRTDTEIERETRERGNYYLRHAW